MYKNNFLEVRRRGFSKRLELKSLRNSIGCRACNFLSLETRFCSNIKLFIEGPLNLRACPYWKRRE